MPHIRYIAVHTRDNSHKIPEFAHLTGLFADIEISQVSLDEGPVSIECNFDDMLASQGIVQRVIEAEKEGVDAVIIDCFGDPALDAAREAVSIPVIGSGESCMLAACMLGDRYAIISIGETVEPILYKHARIYGADQKLVGIRSVAVHPQDIQLGIRQVEARLKREAFRAINDDKADVIVLGCTALVGLGDKIQAAVRDEFKVHIPVVNAVRTPLLDAVKFVALGISHSKLCYRTPVPRRITGMGQMFAPFRLAGNQ